MMLSVRKEKTKFWGFLKDNKKYTDFAELMGFCPIVKLHREGSVRSLQSRLVSLGVLGAQTMFVLFFTPTVISVLYFVQKLFYA